MGIGVRGEACGEVAQHTGHRFDGHTVLKELVTEAKGLKKSDYSEKTWKALQNALKAAEEVFGNGEATQAEVDKAAENLD